ncbi:MAG: gliding motility-associated C-terminal domain-containing protein [Bacteroidales bacterium]|nr:gliding motility-associated C-terminal domain-containing protein [Bacteroidales bacterium]
MFTLSFLCAVAGFGQADHCETVLLTQDTTIFVGQSVPLQSHNLFEYTWLPEAAFTNPHDSNQTVSPTEMSTYYITGRYISDNIVTNGDFESGNTGFTSGYSYYTTNSNTWGVIGQEGTYTINTNSANVHNNFGNYPCLDHTYGNGTGKCMYVNGAGSANTTVWQQVIPVIPNTDHIFITWVASLAQGQSTGNNELARLQFSINGQTIGNIFTAPTATSQWQQFYQIWNSGNSTTATIRILNQNTVGSGNDFALDDISFSPMYPCEDSVTVEVLIPLYALPDTVEACIGDAKTLYPLDNDTIDAFCTAQAPVEPEIIRYPSHAQVTVMGTENEQFQIQFDPDFVGEDTLLYRICCANNCDTAMVTLISKGYTSEFWDTACVQYAWNGRTYSATGDYDQHFSAADGCDSTATMHLTILNPTVSIVSNNPDFCSTHETVLEVVSDFEHFVWTTGDTTTFISVEEPGTYSVTGSNAFCDGRANITIDNCEVMVYLPTAITPSRSDGINDLFSIPESVRSEISDFEILIFNRWGEIIFASTDKNFVWDGNVKDKPAVGGVYLYQMRYTPAAGKPVVARGTVTVL